MPKPLFGDNGSGHAHPPVALERIGKPLFYDESWLRRTIRYRSLTTSEACCKHAPSAVLAFTNPTLNSYKSPSARL